MTVQEWENLVYNDPNWRKKLDIKHQFLIKEITMTFDEEEMLQKHIDIGKQRQQCVMDLILKDNNFSHRLVKSWVERLMHAEPYAVFYKSHFLGEATDFASAEEYAQKVKIIIENMPPYQEFVTHCEWWPSKPMLGLDEIKQRIKDIRAAIKVK